MWDYEVDWLPPNIEVVERGDLLMWRRITGPQAQQRWANRVGYVRTTASNVEALIDEIFAFFGALPFTWVVGPTSEPRDLAERLARRGLADVGDGNLLTATLPISGLRANDAVRILEATDFAVVKVGLALAQPAASSEDLATMLAERMAYLAHPGCRGGFLVACIREEPVANASYRYSSDGRTVYLGGAETVERWRGQGIYQSLVAYRTEAAIRRGCRYAAIRASRDTSGPILLKRGFADHGHLPIFSRAP